MSQVPAFSGTADAMATVRAGLGFLAAPTPPRCPPGAGRVPADPGAGHALGTAARASILAAFTAAQGYHEDARVQPQVLADQPDRVTKGAATAYTAWVRRAAAHPRVIAALAARDMSESFARTICDWTDKLPEDCQDAADAILVAAARSGAGPGGPGRAGRRDLRPVPAAGPRTATRTRGSRTGRSGWRPRSRAPGSWAGT